MGKLNSVEAVLFACLLVCGCGRRSHDALVGKAALKADAKDLKGTIVTAHLDQPIVKGKNVVWCATFQLAWNELCQAIGEDVRLNKPVPMVAALNRKSVTRDALDDASYVAEAGMIGDGLVERIEKGLARKFRGAARPTLHDQLRALPPDGWGAYAYLFKQLLFQTAFTQMDYPMVFDDEHNGDHNVAAFGIGCYSPEAAASGAMGRQVAILDYRDYDDFVIELQTRSKDDRLILAMVRPAKTLGATAEGVWRRVERTKPQRMVLSDRLEIPVLDFDLARAYSEIVDLHVVSNNKRVDGQRVVFANQTIRFRLDERGAVVKSEAATGLFGGGRAYIFSRPFLILLRRRQAKAPYLAMWIGNAELLVPMESPVDED